MNFNKIIIPALMVCAIYKMINGDWLMGFIFLLLSGQTIIMDDLGTIKDKLREGE